MKTPIYLDNHATTRVDPLVLSEIMPYLTDTYGNPSSKHHSFGWLAAEAVERAREQVAALINADPHEIIFTSGATEANNMVLKCTDAKAVVTTSIEHSSVLKTCEWLETRDCDIYMMTADSCGVACADDMPIVCELVSEMLANNETGAIQPVRLHRTIWPGALFHSDMAQALGKMPIDVKELGVDFASFSAHKIYGPKGVGALYIRGGTDNPIFPLIHGGGHEKGLRAGTQNVPAIVGFGKACELAAGRMEADIIHVRVLRQAFRKRLTDKLGCDMVRFVGDLPHREAEEWRYLPGCLNFSLACGNMDTFMTELSNNVAVSSGSACLALSGSQSYVLAAMGLSADEIARSIRVSIGRFNTMDEIVRAVDHMAEAFKESWR